MTDSTLALVLRHRSETATGTVRVVVRWDRETGWAHLAVADQGAGRLRFAGFHRFAAGGADAVVAELAAAGCVTASSARLDDGWMEIDAVLACREVVTDAVR